MSRREESYLAQTTQRHYGIGVCGILHSIGSAYGAQGTLQYGIRRKQKRVNLILFMSR